MLNFAGRNSPSKTSLAAFGWWDFIEYPAAPSNSVGKEALSAIVPPAFATRGFYLNLWPVVLDTEELQTSETICFRIHAPARMSRVPRQFENQNKPVNLVKKGSPLKGWLPLKGVALFGIE